MQEKLQEHGNVEIKYEIIEDEVKGYTPVIAHPERYTYLHGRKVWLPIVNKAIPVVEDTYVDMVFGTLATLISCILVYYTPKLIKNGKLSLFVASLWPTIVNALIIGWELYKFFGLPFGLSALQVGFGEFVVITIVGLPVFKMVNNKYGNKIKNFSSK